MPKLPNITGKQLITILEKKGFVPQRQKGSHVRLKNPENRVVTIPVHANKILGKGLLLKILRDAELSKEDLIKLLE
ncbi:MAG: type II toxin-antitoxin system HicA family toxin [Snowella sp.]|nr:type II toxin-antitoxin system HicA family toxin [Snowella sp.]